MILVIAVALWIVWVAPYVLRNGRHQLQPAGELLADVVDIATADPQAGKVMMMTPQQEKPMTSTQRTLPATSPTPTDGLRQSGATVPVFRIRYGRLALALAGLLALLTGVISAALRIFGLGPAWLPVVTLLGAAGAVVVLRRLAVRDRRRKVNEAFRSAMSKPSRIAPADSAQRSAVSPESEQRADSPLFDAQAVAASPQPEPKPLTALELREAALAEAVASGDLAAGGVQGTRPPVAEAASWEPVEVPKPTYVEAAKAERAAPEPLDLPEAPKAVGKPSLKQDLNQSAASASASADAKVGKGQRALSNLDDVLQRRRA
ncbi:hypothetical protein QFZ69_000937 [Arthrobacter sp. V1I7]|uniref:hypothetical protein n=1 Tax=Arthrobacter sp. V1I7 TaxID=3042274 RepID=UPI0027830392|nr:hypothetical protein [Arthrobacter sp. V1I7]MDQ0820058.1 hypothetical protein [Arthrobacter sp. V1I7]